MKVIALAAICAAVYMARPVLARLGETEEECIKRYGEPQKEDENGSYFLAAGMMVVVKFHDGKCTRIVYMKRESFEALSDVEIETLLKANGGEREWKERKVLSVDRHWETIDGSLFAQYDTFTPSLYILTKEERKRYIEEKDAKERKALEGL
jgi:hypothetical protein